MHILISILSIYKICRLNGYSGEPDGELFISLHFLLILFFLSIDKMSPHARDVDANTHGRMSLNTGR